MSDARRPLETARRDGIPDRDTESPSHQRPPYADPVPGDPTAPGAPHEPGGMDFNQSSTDTTRPDSADRPDAEERARSAPKPGTA